MTCPILTLPSHEFPQPLLFLEGTLIVAAATPRGECKATFLRCTRHIDATQTFPRGGKKTVVKCLLYGGTQSIRTISCLPETMCVVCVESGCGCLFLMLNGSPLLLWFGVRESTTTWTPRPLSRPWPPRRPSLVACSSPRRRCPRSDPARPRCRDTSACCSPGCAARSPSEPALPGR